MSSDVEFRIVCTNCGCLAIKIEEPLKAKRDAIVRCGDCGISRGTVGALRDLSVRQHSDIVLSTSPAEPPLSGKAVNDMEPGSKISKQYAELQRLRQEVEIAERLARESNRRPAIGHSPSDAKYLGFRPSPFAAAVSYLDKQDEKRPA
jgi:hypothetical protein